MTSDLHVPKRRSPVELTLLDGRVLGLEIFLSEFAQQHSGPERVSDLLNGAQEFLPSLDPSGDPAAHLFLRRENVVLARLAKDLEPLGAELQNIATEHEVELRLSPDLVLRGLITYELPAHSARLIDYLNGAPTFFPVVEDHHFTLVNKSHITSALLLPR